MSDEQKKRAAERALDHIEGGMTLGLGTGSTAAFMIKALGAKVRAGLEVAGVPSSLATQRLAEAEGIPLISPDETTRLDLHIDGADEVTADGAMIKGGGAALLREKLCAHAARRFILIADASKRVRTLGQFPLPAEIVPFAEGLTIAAIREALAKLGFGQPEIRLRADKERGGFTETDNGNLVADLFLGRIDDPYALDTALTMIPGVVTTGLFLGFDVSQILATEEGFLP